MDDLPSFEELRLLIVKRPKPPIRARVVESNNGTLTNQASVVHDGESHWLIDDAERFELNTPTSTVLVEDDQITAYTDMIVCSKNWVKSMFQGSLIFALKRWDTQPRESDGTPFVATTVTSLDEGTFQEADDRAPSGNVLGREQVCGRACYVVDFDDVKDEADVTFRSWIDAEFGFILRMTRLDLDMVIEVESLTIGKHIEPDFSEDDFDLL